MIKTKTCPFCGCHKIKLEDTDNLLDLGVDRLFRVICIKCGASAGWQETPLKAFERWEARDGKEM